MRNYAVIMEPHAPKTDSLQILRELTRKIVRLNSITESICIYVGALNLIVEFEVFGVHGFVDPTCLTGCYNAG